MSDGPEPDAWYFEHTPDIWHKEVNFDHPIKVQNFYDAETRNIRPLFSAETVRDFVVDTLAEIGEDHTEISDETRNGMQVFANRMLEKLKEVEE